MRRRSQEEWEQLIQQQKDSGQTAKKFCQAHDLNEHYFSCVKYRFRKQEKKASQFQPLGSLLPTQGISLHCGETIIRLPASVDATWLATLIKHLTL